MRTEREKMKYLLTIYADPTMIPPYDTPEGEAMLQDFMTLGERMAGRAAVLAGEGLAGNETATTLRVQSGALKLHDGAFAQGDEQLGGFFLIEAATLDDALAFAAAIPTARCGAVEIRPIEIFG